jgi:two-component system, NtrC family, response regulator
MPAEGLKLLIVEDDAGLQSQLRWALSDHKVLLADSREKALAIAEEQQPQVAILDLGLPPDPDGASEGLATLQGLLRLNPLTKVIVASGNEERANAVRAISLGAYDFCAKPVDIDMLRLIVERVYNVHRLEVEHQELMRQSSAQTALGGLITGDPAMQRLCHTLEKIARTDVTLLITGESGTGKELLARALHDLSPRVHGRFVAINCAAIPENLLESELFGYEKGAFTGAVKTTPGKIELADGGTLFLDEIGDLPASLQAKLLRFLQDRLIERVGARRTIPVDVRIVCATNRNLERMIEEGSFREDLYYRLNEMRLEVPPLRERHGDAVVLAKYFLARLNKQYNKSLRGFSADALAAIAAYGWPGNVRQLENYVKKAVVMADGRTVTAADLGLAGVARQAAPMPTLQEVRQEAERKLVSDVLAATQGNISKTARILGVSRPTLYMMMRNLGLRAEE